jgi:hypothetical protein
MDISTVSMPPVSTTIPIIDPQNKPKHSHCHPDLYTHKDKSAYPQFRGGLEAKLQIDARAIGQEEEQV